MIIPESLRRTALIYPLVLVLFGVGAFAVLQHGQRIQSAGSATSGTIERPPSTPGSTVPPASMIGALREHFQDPLTRLLIQLILIVMIARLCGTLARWVGQPAVIGEMIAGILLGPSLAGWLCPGFFQFVFPTSSLGTLRMLSQIGVCLFMFVVGMELDLGHLRHQARTAFLVSQVSILFPYFLGLTVSLLLYPALAAPNTTFVPFALFIGISMSITAFPVLARILEERGLMKTALGTTAIACAATDDVTAWCILAFVVAVVKAGDLTSLALSLGLVAVFVTSMLFYVKPRMSRWLRRTATEGTSAGKGIIAGVLVFVFASALVTDIIGIHALFGAFLAGVVMPPRGDLREFLRIRLEHFSSVFLLPLFFAFTGLRTQIGLLNDAGGWAICLGLVLVATLGKWGGAMVTARLTGVNWVDSFALGALMNTRGLIELVALNIGYDLGILSPRMFAMLVIMALVTTGLTGPLLNLADLMRTRKQVAFASGSRVV